MSIKTWQERMGVDKWQNVAMQSEIDELRAALAVEKKAADHWMGEANRDHNLLQERDAEIAGWKADQKENLANQCNLQRLNSHLAHQWHRAINQLNDDDRQPLGTRSWMYEARTMADEVARLTKLFEKQRLGSLPQSHQQCSMQQPQAITNTLTCCLGVKTLECKELLALEKMIQVDPADIDAAKAWTCVGHIVSRGGDVMREGYVTSTSDRMFWDHTYRNMAGAIDNDTETDSI